MKNFKKGDEVLCIDDSDLLWKDLEAGKHYTISRVDYDNYADAKTGKQIVVLFLVEVDKSQPFNSARFIKPNTDSLSKQLAEEFIEQDAQQKEIDVPERVFSTTEDF